MRILFLSLLILVVSTSVFADECTPATEICNNIDDDCDGEIDENLTQSTTCGVGVCLGNTGFETCTEGVFGNDTCNPAEGSQQEICNNLDDDCDGTVDDFSYDINCGVGACEDNTGSNTCTAGVWINDTCDPFSGATNEICDNIDNDCDGLVDDEIIQLTTCGVGSCSGNTGYESCTEGIWGDDTCNLTEGAIQEICNNLDDDCDGTVDEDLTQETNCGVGACEGNTGVKTCSNGNWSGNTCDSLFGEAVETCDNIDNDCDGLVDEDLTQASTCGEGICSGNIGRETCSNGIWGEDTCDPFFGAIDETCNDLDDDCDGLVDDEVIRTTTCEDASFSGTQTCIAGGWGADTCDSLNMGPGETIPLILTNNNRQHQTVFEVYGQSMWQDGIVPDDSSLYILPEESLTGDAGFDEDTTFRIPYASDVIDSIISFFGSDFETEVTLGGGLGVDSEGGISISSKLSNFEGGTVDVKYPQDINVKYPAANTFRADDTIELDTSVLPYGASLTSYPSEVDFEMKMDFRLKETFSGNIDYGFGTSSFDEELFDIDEPDITLLHLDEYEGWYSDTSVYPPYQGLPDEYDYLISSKIGTTSAVCGEVDCIRFLIGATGYIEMPHPMPTTNELNAQGDLVASDTNTFGSVDINLNSGSKIGMALAIDTKDFIDPDDVYGFEVTSKLLDADVFLTSKIKQDLTFAPTTNIRYDFSDNIKHNGLTTNTVTILAGSSLNIEMLPDQIETITVTPTVLFENEFHNKYVHKDRNEFSVEGGTFSLTIPGVPLLPTEFSIPDISDWECAEEVCIPAGCLIWPLHNTCWDKSCSCVLWLPKIISVGPYTTPSLELGPVGPSFHKTPSYDVQDTVVDQTFELGGFDTDRVLASFVLDPQIAPFAVIIEDEDGFIIDEGSNQYLDGSQSYDVDNDPIRLYWDLDNDGNFEVASPTASYLGADDGTYIVSLMANDPYGYNTVQTTITVENVIPVVDAGVDQIVDEGDLVSISGYFSDPGWLDTHTSQIDWGDGSVIESGVLTEENMYPDSTGTVTADHAYGDNGVYTVTITITDDDGGVGVDTLTVTVNNIAPSVEVSEDWVVDEGDFVSISGYFIDPGWFDTHTSQIDWDDGTTESGILTEENDFPDSTGTVTADHVYGDNGIYTVTVTITDDDGGVGTDTLTVIVNNVAPTANIDSMTQSNPQFILPIVHELVFDGSFADPGWLDTHMLNWDFGDGTSSAETLIEENEYPESTGIVIGNKIYSDNGTFTVVLTITDDDGGFATDSMTVVVVNAREANKDLSDYIQGLDDASFDRKADQQKKTLLRMFEAIDTMIEKEAYKGAIGILRNYVRVISDGHIDGDLKGDRIIDPEAQYHICMKIDDLTAYLEYLNL